KREVYKKSGPALREDAANLTSGAGPDSTLVVRGRSSRLEGRKAGDLRNGPARSPLLLSAPTNRPDVPSTTRTSQTNIYNHRCARASDYWEKMSAARTARRCLRTLGSSATVTEREGGGSSTVRAARS